MIGLVLVSFVDAGAKEEKSLVSVDESVSGNPFQASRLSVERKERRALPSKVGWKARPKKEAWLNRLLK